MSELCWRHIEVDMRLVQAILVMILAAIASVGTQSRDQWTSRFDVKPGDLGPTGGNAYFTLEPGRSSTFQDRDEQLVITVLGDTKEVDGVMTRVVEERETRGSQLVEISRNYVAISATTRDVYYFGEDVDIYKDGKVVGHEGAWESGRNGARFGLMMPASPHLSMKYYQEVAPKVAMDRAAIVAVDEVVRTPAGLFKGCVKMEETTPLEPGVREYKFYARDVGLVQDGSLKLVARR